MGVRLDGQALFDDEQIEIAVGGLERACSERSVAGLDGVLSVDMGLRGRKIRQWGTLRAGGMVEMRARVGAISAMMDGATHKLVTGEGDEYDDVRVDSFEVSDVQKGGIGVVCNYEIVYRQLKV